jgi:hypothetical protein
MGSLQTVLEAFTRDPKTWEAVQKELSSSENPRKRFEELVRQKGLSVDGKELDAALARAQGEMNENDLDRVAGGFNPQPDPPGRASLLQTNQSVLIGMLLPAVQKSFVP